jgi:hypothetical protein
MKGRLKEIKKLKKERDGKWDRLKEIKKFKAGK